MDIINFLLNLTKGRSPIAGMLSPVSPTASTRAIPTSAPTAIPSAQLTKADYQKAIEEGYKNWGDLPISQYASQLAEAPVSGYDIFKQYPFLLAAIAVNESSGGKNVTYENNPLNWAIKAQKKGEYSPKSWEEVINNAMTAIGGRSAEEGFTPTQVATSSYYEPFRKSKNLQDFVNTYVTTADKNDVDKYLKDLKNVMSVFESQLRKK